MSKLTSLKEKDLFRNNCMRLKDMLRASVESFQNGEDLGGIEILLSAVDALESIVETDNNLQNPRIELRSLLPALRELYFFIQNQDISGIVDFLQDTLSPIIEAWIKGCDGE